MRRGNGEIRQRNRRDSRSFIHRTARKDLYGLKIRTVLQKNLLTVKGGRFLTLNTVIRVNQIEAARNLNEGEDEAAVHTPETVAAFRDAVSKGFPGCQSDVGFFLACAP